MPTRSAVIRKAESALAELVSWAAIHGLTFSKEKSIMVPLKSDLVPVFTAKFADESIKSKSKVDYLGITIKTGINFDEHISRVVNKNNEILSRLMSGNLNGASALLMPCSFTKQSTCQG